jgi:thioredoxin-related protein
MRNVVILFALLLCSFSIYSFKNINTDTLSETPPAGASIKWMTWEQVFEKSKSEKRKIFVDVYTDWCGWCKRMDASTFQKQQIADYINQHYYAVKFNAEYKGDIVFKGKTYKFIKEGMNGYHELAAEITHGRLSYPTVVFLDENLDLLQAIPGYREALEFEQIITYFGKDEHKKTPWEVYQRNYKPIAKN